MTSEPSHQRRLRPLVISMGGERQTQIEQMFANNETLRQHFEAPVFTPGIPSRHLRNRYNFIETCYEIGLIPQQEWEAVKQAQPLYLSNPEHLFDCLDNVPIQTDGRHGSLIDLELHYTVELWTKARAINRGRAVLACLLAHLRAIKRLVDEDFDFILEDNVRVPISECANRMWQTLDSSIDSSSKNGPCHYRYYGWLGSTSNTKYIYNTHIEQRKLNATDLPVSVFPFPSQDEIQQDIDKMKDGQTGNAHDNKSNERDPGGNPLWGCYAYWVSSDGYNALLDRLKHDVGAMLWKSKRARHYSVKPIDKILPRFIMSHFGRNAVHVTSHPAFFRAPMLTSKIHTKWDPEFCKSTQLQLDISGLRWSDLWLTETERMVVANYAETGEWVTPSQLNAKAEDEETPLE